MTPETVEEELDKTMLEYLQNQIVIDDEKQEVRAVQSFQSLTLTVTFIINSLLVLFNLLTTNVSHHIETSQLVCIANQFTGFYMIVNICR